jgi:hypothetical protein
MSGAVIGWVSQPISGSRAKRVVANVLAAIVRFKVGSSPRARNCKDPCPYPVGGRGYGVREPLGGRSGPWEAFMKWAWHVLAVVALVIACGCGGGECTKEQMEAAVARCERCLDACSKCNDPLASCVTSCRGCDE